jgi:hypothetical protein
MIPEEAGRRAAGRQQWRAAGTSVWEEKQRAWVNCDDKQMISKKKLTDDVYTVHVDRIGILTDDVYTVHVDRIAIMILEWVIFI